MNILKSPKLSWENNEIPSIEINTMSNGELPEDYLTKYIVKGRPKRGAKGDILVAAYEKLQPENAVTTGVFTKMYNRVCSKGPVPIFNVVHNNLNLPLVLTNFNTKACSVLGISLVASSNQECNEEDIENKDYINPSLIEKFAKRWDDVVKIGKLVRKEDFRKKMSVKEFCDRFEGKWTKNKESNENVLSLSVRREFFNGIHYSVRLIPHLTKARANPISPKHWLYCKHLCLWLIPCHTISEILPDRSLEEKDESDFWSDKFNTELEEKDLLPKWAKRHLKEQQIEFWTRCPYDTSFF